MSLSAAQEKINILFGQYPDLTVNQRRLNVELATKLANEAKKLFVSEEVVNQEAVERCFWMLFISRTSAMLVFGLIEVLKNEGFFDSSLSLNYHAVRVLILQPASASNT